MTTTCQRCKKERHYLETCYTCSRNVCQYCQKSGKSASKTERLIICKDCWSDLKKRKKWESA